ncbi:MAG TPA: adenosylcobinamide-GDP ribazoletransferase [Actinocrinis sp.]|nr:adenosylcobinamide-GDP ribazoletransferase [Actinocrinis sp.]
MDAEATSGADGFASERRSAPDFVSATAQSSASAGASADTAPPGPLMSGLRLSFSTLTIIRVGIGPGPLSPRAPGIAMKCAPLVGVVLGAAAAAAGWVLRWWAQSDLLAAIAAIAVLAVLTRALHLDGLADTADALGSNRPADQALQIMKRSDIGPFGVAALVLVALLQIGGATVAFAHHREFVALIAAAAVGRLAVTAACTKPIPSARPNGLGAWVAGSVSVRAAVAIGVLLAASCGALGLATDARTAALAVTAVPVGLAVALLVLHRCIDRLGGITGDVLGALVESATTAALLVLAFH